jgi:hypothetical protein
MFVFSIEAVNAVQSTLFKILPSFCYMDYFHCTIYMRVCVFSVEMMVWFALLIGSIIVLYDVNMGLLSSTFVSLICLFSLRML